MKIEDDTASSAPNILAAINKKQGNNIITVMLNKLKIMVNKSNIFDFKKAMLWAKKVRLKGNAKKILLALAKNSDEYGRVPISVNSLLNATNISVELVILELEFLALNKIIVFLDGDDLCCTLKQLLDQS